MVNFVVPQMASEEAMGEAGIPEGTDAGCVPCEVICPHCWSEYDIKRP